MLQEIEVQGSEGAEAEMASIENLTDEDVFHEQNCVVITPDLGNVEVNSRKDALAHLDIVTGSGIMNSDMRYKTPGDAEFDGGRRLESEGYNTLRSDATAASEITDTTTCNTDMSMSLDSLLKQVVGTTDNYQTEFGSNASFKTFGKMEESSHVNSTSPQHIPATQTQYYDDIQTQPPPIPKPRASKSKSKKKRAPKTPPQSPERNSKYLADGTTNSPVLETDIDSYDFEETVKVLHNVSMGKNLILKYSVFDLNIAKRNCF